MVRDQKPCYRLLSAFVVLALTGPSFGQKAVEEKLIQLSKELPGESGFVVTELTDQGPKILLGHRANEPFAIGSSFKLWILGTLIEKVNAGKRKTDDIMRLRSDLIGPPSSEMAEWPMGSPVTLNTLALKMIWISDNTATDHLLYQLGRQRVEAQMPIMGDTHASLNMPLLFTREMVMLRDKKFPGRAEKYLKLDEAGRRKMLETVIDKLHDYDAIDFNTSDWNLAEWYGSPMDMAHAMNWIRLNTVENKPAAPLLKVLTVETKLKTDPKVWPYVGFKGGSEDQLLAGNWLLRRDNGKWFTFHLYFNSKREKLTKEKIEKVVQGMFEIMQTEMK